MRLDRRDWVATLCVAAAVTLYALWSTGFVVPTSWTVRVVTVAALALGVPASALAVIPGFEGLLHGSRVYLALAALIGIAATVVGVLALVQSSRAMLNALMGAMVLMWVMATIRHARAGEAGEEIRSLRSESGESQGLRPAA